MTTPDSLKELYADEMKDLWSANDQMARVMTTLAGKAHDPQLKQNLEASIQGISKHAAALKSLIKETGKEVSPEHCRGMEGLVKEALKHVVEEGPKDGELRDMEIVAQYQRMCHYGIAGFGTAAAYAGALGKADHASKLKSIVSDIYRSDEYASSLSDKAAKAASKAA